jgi:hypothetical protein
LSASAGDLGQGARLTAVHDNFGLARCAWNTRDCYLMLDDVLGPSELGMITSVGVDQGVSTWQEQSNNLRARTVVRVVLCITVL